MEIKEACEAVADLFEAIPETWAMGSPAKDALGGVVWTDSPAAVAWCAIGGVSAAAECDLDAAYYFLAPHAKRIFSRSPTNVNDCLGRLAAIRMLREAAK